MSGDLETLALIQYGVRFEIPFFGSIQRESRYSHSPFAAYDLKGNRVLNTLGQPECFSAPQFAFRALREWVEAGKDKRR